MAALEEAEQHNEKDDPKQYHEQRSEHMKWIVIIVTVAVHHGVIVRLVMFPVYASDALRPKHLDHYDVRLRAFCRHL